MKSISEIGISFILITIVQISSAEIYYVKPTEDMTCPQNDSRPCLTLSQYAMKPDSYFASNVSLLLLPGTHTLNHDFTITNVDNIGMYRIKASQSNTKVHCLGSPRGFIFGNVQQLDINNFEVLDCIWNISYVKQFVFKDMITLSQRNTTITLLYVETANISNTSFAPYNVLNGRKSIGRMMFVFRSDVTITGCEFSNIMSHSDDVMIAYQSNITIRDSKFINNTALNCGVLYATHETNMTIINSVFQNTLNGQNYVHAVCIIQSSLSISFSTFMNNSVNTSGGVFHGEHSRINIDTSNFRFNQALYHMPMYAGGGVINANNCTISISTSYFDNNMADVGGVIYAFNFSTIEVENSTFRYNIAHRIDGGVFYLDQHSSIVIKNGTFLDNGIEQSDESRGGVINVDESDVKITESIFERNFGGWGGVLMSYNSTVSIESSNFTNNRATEKTSNNPSTGQVAIVNSTLRIANSNFKHNTQGVIYCQTASIEMSNVSITKNSGSALSTFLCVVTSNGMITIKNSRNGGTVFLRKSTVIINGSLMFTYNMGSFALYSSSVIFSGHVVLAHNRPLAGKFHNPDILNAGGALTANQESEIIFNGTCQINDNSAAVGGAILLSESKLQILKNLTIANNTATQSGGGVSAFQSEIKIKGNLTVDSNQAHENGGGLYISDTKLFALSESSTSIVQNKASKGGGIFLELNTKVFIKKSKLECNNCSTNLPYNTRSLWISFNLSHNIAEHQGGAIYVNDDTNTAKCNPKQNTTYTTMGECFLQTFALYSLPTDTNRSALNTKNIYFNNNTAKSFGSNLYGGLLDRCRLVHSELELPFKYKELIGGPMTYILNISNINPQQVSSDPLKIIFCKHDHMNHTYQPPTIYTKKGHQFNVSVVAVDQVEHPVSATVHSSLSLYSAGFNEGQVRQQTTSKCTNLTYQIYSSSNIDHISISLYAEGPCNDLGPSKRVMNVTLLPCSCPIGLQPSPDPSNCSCLCDPEIKPFVTNCSARTGTVVRVKNTWIDYVNASNQSGFITYSDCPFDYCTTSPVHINFNDPNGADAQCAFNRSGNLCGSCRNGTSLTFGTSHCMPCSNSWIALVIPFALAGLALVLFILVCNLTVAVGTINGLVFYANIVVANSAIFLPFQKPNLFTVFLAWINLDLGIQTCFYNGMDAYVKTWLQIAFPLYIFLLVLVILVLGEHWEPFARRLRRTGSDPVATLATLVLLSYAKLVRTIIAALSLATLDYPDGTPHTVWLVDADIDYFKGKHIPLVLTIAIITIIGMVYTLLLSSWQLILRCTDFQFMKWLKINGKIEIFIRTYHGPLNAKQRYWTGIMLITRILLFSISTLSDDPRVILLSVIIVCVVFLALHILNIRIYNKWYLNALDASFFSNLIIFSAATLFNDVNATQHQQQAVAYTSTAIALVTFTGILVYHFNKFIRCKMSKLTHTCWKRSSQTNLIDFHSIPTEEDWLVPSQKIVDLPPTFRSESNETI